MDAGILGRASRSITAVALTAAPESGDRAIRRRGRVVDRESVAKAPLAGRTFRSSTACSISWQLIIPWIRAASTPRVWAKAALPLSTWGATWPIALQLLLL